MEEQKTSRYRYPGLNSFTENDTEIFQGRKEDAEKLYLKVMVTQTIVLHAESGTGKSSLIQAGLIPLVRADNEYHPVIVRLYHKSEHLMQNTGSNGPFLTDACADLRTKIPLDQPTSLPFLGQATDSLWILAKKMALGSETIAPKKIMLIFDQFEEFQSYDINERDSLKRNLAELLSLDIPQPYYKLVLEEIAGALNSGDLSEKQRDLFNLQLQFLKTPLDARIIFVVREDKLGTMTLLADQIPDILKNDLVLLPLSETNARKAIKLPCMVDGTFDTVKFEFENNEPVDHIINEIRDKETGLIDPLQVQIVCNNLERRILKDLHPLQRARYIFLNKPSFRKITKKDIPEVNDIIKEFYLGAWDRANENIAAHYPEIKQDALLTIRKNVIKELVVGDHRAMLLEDKFDASEPEKLALDTMIEEGLLRKITAGRDKYIQLCHDRFIKPIDEEKAAFQSTELAEARNHRLTILYNTKKAEEKLKRNRIIAFSGVIICVMSVIIWYKYKSKSVVERQRIFDISKIAARTNPQLSFLIAQDWVDHHSLDKDFSALINSFDSSGHSKQIGIFFTPSPPIEISVSADTLKLLSRSMYSTWKIGDQMILTRQKVPKGGFVSHFRTSSGDQFIFRSDSTISLCDQRQQILFKFPVFKISAATLVKTSADGTRLLVGTHIYDLASKKLLGEIPPFPLSNSGPIAAAFFHQSHYLAVVYAKGYKVVYQLAGPAKKAIRTVLILPPSKGAEVNAISLDDSGVFLAAGNNRNETELWHLPDLHQLNVSKEQTNIVLLAQSRALRPYWLFKGHGDAVISVAVSGDGRFLMTGSRDRLAILWNISTHKRVDALRGAAAPVSYTAINYNGESLVTATDEGEVFLWSREKAVTLYKAGRLNQFSPMDYYNAGLDRKDEVLNKFYQNQDAVRNYKKIFSYISSLPKTNPYPTDNYYTANLRAAIGEIEQLYQNLPANTNYKAITAIQLSTLNQLYSQLTLRKKKLLNEPESDDPTEQHHDAGQQLKANVNNFIENTDLSDINTAVRYSEELVSLTRYYRDTADKPDYKTSMGYIRNGLQLMDVLLQKHENDPDLEYTHTLLTYNKALTYLYQGYPDSARLEANRFDLYNTGDGLANMVYIMAYLYQNKFGPAEKLFRENENKVIWGGDYPNQPLKNRLIGVLSRLRARGKSSQTVVSFLSYLQGRETPKKLIKARKNKPTKQPSKRK